MGMKSLAGYDHQVSEVARILDISTERVRQLDAKLKPIRVGSSKIRLYSLADVEAFKRERDARRAG